MITDNDSESLNWKEGNTHQNMSDQNKYCKGSITARLPILFLFIIIGLHLLDLFALRERSIFFMGGEETTINQLSNKTGNSPLFKGGEIKTIDQVNNTKGILASFALVKSKNISFNTHDPTIVRIINFLPQKKYSVLAFIANTTISSAYQPISETLLWGGIPALDYTLYLPLPGIYSIVVHEFEIRESRPKAKPTKRSRLVRPWYTQISVKKGQSKNAYELMESKLRHLPPCQSLDPQSLTEWRGTWYGPAAKLAPTGGKMRTGWTFFPKKCTLETFNRRDLKHLQHSSVAQNNTIVILGTSKERGVFLSLVDLALYPSQKVKMESSFMRKCWGRMSVQIGSMKFVYQDIRPDMFKTNDAFKTNDGTIICHNDNLAKPLGLLRNTNQAIKKMFEHKENVPKVILLNSGCGLFLYNNTLFLENVLSCTVILKSLISSIPSTWNGTIYTVDSYSFSATITQSMNEKEYITYTNNLKKWTFLVNDTRVRMLDTVSLGNPMGLTAEIPGTLHSSVHWHHFCDQEDIKVCSNVTDTVAQLILARAVAPEGKKFLQLPHSSQDISQEIPQMVACADCPVNLFPFHVKVVPELRCIAGPLKDDDTFYKVVGHNKKKCPAWCMTNDTISGYEGTESDVVTERTCSL